MPVQIPPLPGSKVWLKDMSPNRLPAGWVENQQVLVLKQEGLKVVVRELDGERELELPTTAVDGGWIFALPGGEELHESHPRVIVALRKVVDRELASSLRNVTWLARTWVRVLQRNGVEIELPKEPEWKSGEGLFSR